MSDGLTRFYAPDDVTFSVGNQPAVGVHEGTFIEVDRAVDIGRLDIGSDGEATMSVSPNQSSVTILMSNRTLFCEAENTSC